jgi:hypothetical protein
MSVQGRLADLIGSDKGSISGDHFGRAPGFRNRKKNRDDFLVRVLSATSSGALDVDQYLALDVASPCPSPVGGVVRSGLCSASGGCDGSESAAEFRFCLARFLWAVEKGRDPHGEVDFLMQNILERAIARGKKSTGSYVKTTVSKALASVLLHHPS